LTQHGVALRGAILGVRKKQVNKTARKWGNLRGKRVGSSGGRRKGRALQRFRTVLVFAEADLY
jgi:hypothetical protein